jgi:hypothetical protein
MTALHKAGALTGALLLALAGGCQILLGVTGEDVPLPSDGGVGHCDDGVKGSDETDKDCGGTCAPCADGKGCLTGTDCLSRVCSAGTCLAAKCDDKVKNGDETDVDCGGETCSPCAAGLACLKSSDCAGGYCQAGKCQALVLWANGYANAPPPPATAMTANSIAFDPSGSVIFAGSTLSDVSFGGSTLSGSDVDTFVAKLDPDGGHAWSVRFGGTGIQIPLAVATDKSGAVVLAGAYTNELAFAGLTWPSQGGINDGYIAKLDASGVPQWGLAFSGTGSQWLRAIATDSATNIWLAGQFSGDAAFGGGAALHDAGNGNVVLAKVDPSGVPAWAASFGDQASQGATSVAVDAADNVIVCGYNAGTVNFGDKDLTSASGDADLFLAKFDKQGVHQWSKAFGDSADQKNAWVATTADGAIVLGGDFNGSIDFGKGKLTSQGGTDLFLAKFDGAGKILWNKRFGDANAQAGAGVAVDTDGGLYLLSTCMGVVDFGGGPLTSSGGATSGADVFIAKFDGAGNHVWSARYGDSHDQAGTGLAAQKGAAILGTFGGTLDFGTKSLMATGTTDVFVARLLPP